MRGKVGRIAVSFGQHESWIREWERKLVQLPHSCAAGLPVGVVLVPKMSPPRVLPLLFGFAAAALSELSAPIPLPSWTAPRPNASLPFAGYARAANVTTALLFSGTPENGAYNHAAMITYWDGVVTASWKNGIGASGEDAPGQRVKYAQTTNGETWTSAALLFENMTTAALPVALFAGPFAVLNGRLYASATPAVIATGDAQGSQFCQWPDGVDPRNAGVCGSGGGT